MMPRCHRLFALTLCLALAGCPTRPKPAGTGAPDARVADTALPGPGAADVTPGPGADEQDARGPAAKPQQPRHTLGPILRSARFRGATTPPPYVPGILDGDPFVAIVAAAEPDALPPGYAGASFDIACFLGRTPLWLVDGSRGRVVLVGRDPGGDLGKLPVWCAAVPNLVGPAAVKESLDAAYLAVTTKPELARWLRGPDGRGPAPPTIEVAPRRPSDPYLGDFGRWLAGKEGRK